MCPDDPVSLSLEDGMESSGPKRRRICEPQPKHDIFLSHSGQEKPFVEQLYHDLRSVNQRAFFDQDSNCLAKAEKFAREIIDAAGRCRVGVVVVSEGYLTSKWPMLELSRFVECGVKVFPLFFKLSPSDLKGNEVETKWKLSWRQLVERGEVKEEVLESWSKAVKELRSWNGLEYGKFANSEYKYRCAVVEEICKLWPPRVKCSTDVPKDEIQGYERLCKMASSMFTEAKVGDEEIHWYLGLYGMGGVGKTTLCKAMCSYSQGEFGDRVCYVELSSEQGNDRTARKERLARLKHAIRRLADFYRSVPDSVSEEGEEGWECLKDRLRDQLPVFLAIDNVGDCEASRSEARKYLNVGLPPGSKVLVTARSQEILKSVLGESEYCKPIPRLEWLEAATLFLSYAAPTVLALSDLKAEERDIVESCLSECRFEEIGYPSSQYHPLVLRALGTYFHDVDGGNVMRWEEALVNRNKLQRSREARNVNVILGLNYHSLSEQVKLVFLDCAIYSSHGSRIWEDRPWWYFGEADDMSMWVSWISEVHGVSLSDAKLMVKELQRLSLVEDSSSVVSVHDLYKEFARVLVEMEGSKEWQWWMSHVTNATQLERLVLYRGKPIICRAMGRFVDFRSLVYLELVGCDDIGSYLELGNLQSLRVLCVYDCWNLKRVVCSCNNGRDDHRQCYERAGSRGCLTELMTVKLRWLESLEAVPFLRHCGSLQHLEVTDTYGSRYSVFGDSDADPESEEPIDFRYLKAVRTISIRGGRFMAGYDRFAFIRWLLSALQLENLTAFEFRREDCWDWLDEEYGDIEDYTFDLNEVVQLSPRLSVLSLGIPKEIKEVKGLHLLSELTTLNLNWCEGLRRLPDLRCLPKLKRLCVFGCCNLEALPLLGPEVRGIPCLGGDSLWGHDTSYVHHECLQPYCFNE
ncbi:hypothetical protein KC19_2G076200 [Ceratodon purpureus]|uniref:TIR domain-containing protein n=1 Tax=Ceratodon purpureus TaxID=3225 RepID=A0A8T0ITY0_CERPU|nr:hypothetical protein KC19_2G076200 [Ceratodon purpureus]